jgi:LPPG:FO 2-phospho-L-lactate transferase
MSDMPATARVVLLAGGVGGARMARGMAAALAPGALTVVANVGDDDRFYGLKVCPDLDTILYTLSGRVSRSQGWGVEGDTTRALEQLAALGAPAWMKLGDTDFGLHIYRTWRLEQGGRLTEVMHEAAQCMGVTARLLPAADTPVPTQVKTGRGWLSLQEWFVQERAEPDVRGLRYCGAAAAAATPEVLDEIRRADAIVIAPSNPLLSIEPILALPGVREALRASRAPCIAVSPLINGKAVKGPLARMLSDLGMAGKNRGIAQIYKGLIDGLVIDASDHEDCTALRQQGLAVLPTNTLIQDAGAAHALARRVVDWVTELAGSDLQKAESA